MNCSKIRCRVSGNYKAGGSYEINDWLTEDAADRAAARDRANPEIEQVFVRKQEKRNGRWRNRRTR